jgi:co-chaperonin GroES (HSP10)
VSSNLTLPANFITKREINMQATRNNVIVERIAASKETTSGIILKSTEEPDKALVLNVGPDVLEVSEGDLVLLNWNKATAINDVYIIPEDDIVLKFED